MVPSAPFASRSGGGNRPTSASATESSGASLGRQTGRSIGTGCRFTMFSGGTSPIWARSAASWAARSAVGAFRHFRRLMNSSTSREAGSGAVRR